MRAEDCLDLYNYGRGTNGTAVVIGDVTLYFSYRTVVAFREPGHGIVCSENVWSPTTGGHLNHICDKEDRIPYNEFEARLENSLKRHGLLK